jgi:hypothetical protein
MKSKLVGLILLLVIGEVLGVVFGSIFFHLFEKTVPPAILTSFNKGTAHAAFIVYGLVCGFVIFVWGIVVAGAAHVFRGASGK